MAVSHLQSGTDRCGDTARDLNDAPGACGFTGVSECPTLDRRCRVSDGQHHAHGHDHDPSHGDDHSHGHDHSHGEGSDHLAIEGFTSLSFQSDGPFSLRKFQNFLDNQMPQEVFRAKGILWFNESERRHVFHLAGKRFSIDDTDWTGERKNQLVLIGRDIDHDTLRQQLQACVDEEAAGTPSAGSSGNGLN
mgnify:CR=1 FL=1